VLKTAVYQLSRRAKERGWLGYDGLIDAVAGAVRWWTDRMGRDVDEDIKDRDEERLDQMLQDFIDGVSLSGKTQNGKPINQRQQKDWGSILRPS